MSENPIRICKCPVTKPDIKQIAMATGNKVIRFQWETNPETKIATYTCEMNGMRMPVKEARARMLANVQLINEVNAPCIV